MKQKQAFNLIEKVFNDGLQNAHRMIADKTDSWPSDVREFRDNEELTNLLLGCLQAAYENVIDVYDISIDLPRSNSGKAP